MLKFTQFTSSSTAGLTTKIKLKTKLISPCPHSTHPLHTQN